MLEGKLPKHHTSIRRSAFLKKDKSVVMHKKKTKG